MMQKERTAHSSQEKDDCSSQMGKECEVEEEREMCLPDPWPACFERTIDLS
jgi:hypothetical protein